MENNNLTTLIVENSVIQEHLDRAVALAVSQVVEIMAEKNQNILDWVQEEQALKLLNLKNEKHFRKIVKLCNIPTGKPGKTIFYSIKGLNAYIENSSTISIDLK